MEVAPDKKNSGSVEAPMQESSLKQENGVGLPSPLAAQLQQLWLQTQLPKRSVPRTDFLSPLPLTDYQADPFQQQLQRQQQQYQYAPAASPSSSFSQQSSNSNLSRASLQHSPDSVSDAYSSSEGGSAGNSGGQDELGGSESEPMMEDDTMLQYLSDILMDEEMADQKSVQGSAYQAMTKELADLIGEKSPALTDDVYGNSSAVPATRYDEAEKDIAVNSWIDEVLNSNPSDFFPEEQMRKPQGVPADLADEVSSIASGITNITTGTPRSRSTVSTPQEATSAPAPAPTLAAAPVVDKPHDLLNFYDSICPYLEDGLPVYANVDYMNGRSGIESLVELYPLLMQCAQAVATDNIGEAQQLINYLRPKTSPLGDGGQRMAYYVVEALVARLSGAGAQLYTALSSSRPSQLDMLKAYHEWAKCNPLKRLCHFFANATILNAVQGSDRIHIIDYGILNGIQWSALFKKLSKRGGGAPHVRITGIGVAEPGVRKPNTVEDTGSRLESKAKEAGVELEFHAIVGKWETITAAQLKLRDNETLIVNCMFGLKSLLDETVMASSPRKVVLSRILSLKPKLFNMGVISTDSNSPFFMARFRDTISHYSAMFDSIHCTMAPDSDMRRMAEKEILGRGMLNIIACEGAERTERAETYRQWQSRSINAGFKQLPLNPTLITKAHHFLKNYNRNFGIGVDGNWFLCGWKDRVTQAVTAWTP